MDEIKTPTFKTIREVAKMGILSEYNLRLLEKQHKLPCIYSGNRCKVNVDKLILMLNKANGGLEDV